MEVDKCFLHFEKVATNLQTSITLILQGSLPGKAVKRHILKAYELVPEAHCQKFKTIQKVDTKTFVEFAWEK